MFREAAEKAIRSGRIKGWDSPILVPVGPQPLAFPHFGNDRGNIRSLQEIAKHGTMDEYRKMREGK